MKKSFLQGENEIINTEDTIKSKILSLMPSIMSHPISQSTLSILIRISHAPESQDQINFCHSLYPVVPQVPKQNCLIFSGLVPISHLLPPLTNNVPSLNRKPLKRFFIVLTHLSCPLEKLLTTVFLQQMAPRLLFSVNLPFPFQNISLPRVILQKASTVCTSMLFMTCRSILIPMP